MVKGQSIPTSRETSQERKYVGKTCKKTTELLAKQKLCYSVCVTMFNSAGVRSLLVLVKLSHSGAVLRLLQSRDMVLLQVS